ncbi:MAG: hypothetical protein EPN88_13065 [Bacteroidetes bacterium]|nr:MAG: hypothetical protein EPN88_13065 [Bacteroidota bacterium]
MVAIRIKIIFRITIFSVILFIFSSLLATNINCKKNTTEPNNNGAVSLAVEDASCTKVWLNAQQSNITLPQKFILYENDCINLQKTFILTSLLNLKTTGSK